MRFFARGGFVFHFRRSVTACYNAAKTGHFRTFSDSAPAIQFSKNRAKKRAPAAGAEPHIIPFLAEKCGENLNVSRSVVDPSHRACNSVRTLKVVAKISLAALIGAWCMMVESHASGAATSPSKPHIVLFIADDFSWNDSAPYGNWDVRTPNLEQLTIDGMKFNFAFAASPTCTPSRSAMYTGLYPMRNGAHANHSLIKDGIKTLPVYMKELGYRVVIAGKTHIGPREEFPFEYLPNSNIMPPGKHALLWTDLNTKAVDELLSKHDVNQPLCLIVCAHSPHVYWPDNDGYNPASLKLPPSFLDTTLTRYERAKYYTDVTWMDKQVGEVRASLAKHGFSNNTLFMFTADQGAQWPFEKWTLYDGGIRVPLIASYPDHIKPGTTSNAMISLVDLLPTMIRAGGGSPRTDDLDGRDFLPVLLGQSDHFHDEIYAAHTGDKEMNHAPMRCIRTSKFKYIHNLAPQIRYTTHISEGEDRDGRGYWASWLRLAETDPAAQKVIDRFHNLPAEQLFDVEKDPYELKNLAQDPQYKKTLEELREKVNAWRLQQGEDLNKVPMPEDARTGELKYAG